jgi:hypothetical protein
LRRYNAEASTVKPEYFKVLLADNEIFMSVLRAVCFYCRFKKYNGIYTTVGFLAWQAAWHKHSDL